MTRYGMLVDTRRNIGCCACRAACQNQNKLSAEVSFIKRHALENGSYPHVKAETVPTQCMHCEDAPCAKVCPTARPANVRIFGDLDDPESELSKAIAESNAKPISGDLAKTKVFCVR